MKGNTIETYTSQANTVPRLFTNHNLSPQLKDELYKLMNNDDNVNEKFIIDNMNPSHLIDITPTVEELRANYYNDNSFKSYLNILVVISSHLPSLKDNIKF